MSGAEGSWVPGLVDMVDMVDRVDRVDRVGSPPPVLVHAISRLQGDRDFS